MAGEHTLLIPLDGGLDLYSNPHRLDPSTLSAAVGVALNRPGYAYPGPGLTDASIATMTYQFGSAAYSLPQTTASMVVTWGVLSGANFPRLYAAGGVVPAQPQMPVYPFRQNVRSLGSPPTQYTLSNLTSTSPQLVTNGSTQAVAWEVANYDGVAGHNAIAVKFVNEVAGAQSPVYFLKLSTATLAEAGLVTGDQSAGKFAIALVGTTLWIGTVVAAVLKFYKFTVPVAFATATSITGSATTITGTYTDLSASCDRSLSTAAFVTFDFNNLNIVGFAASASSVTTSPAVILSSITSAAPYLRALAVSVAYSGATTLTPSGFLVAAYNDSTQPRVALVNTSLTVVKSVTFTHAFAELSGYVPAQCTVQMTDGATALDNITVITEWKPSSATTTNGFAWHYNVVQFLNTSFSTPSVFTNAEQSAWGGLGLLGKARLFTWGQTTNPATGATVNLRTVLVPLRTGWQATDGTWGTAATAGVVPAFPCGYLYDGTGNLVASFSRETAVGTNATWLGMDQSGYCSVNLPVLSDAIVTGPTDGQSIAWTFPQVFDTQTVSSAVVASGVFLRSDAGAIIGATASPSVVQWTDCNQSSPPATMVQQGTTLVVPGALTTYFDGANAVEAGFLGVAPTPLAALNTTAGSPFAADFAPQYRTCLVATDANGKEQRSQPSLPFQAPKITGINQGYNIVVPYFQQTYQNAKIELYRAVVVQDNVRWFLVPATFIFNSTAFTATPYVVVADANTDVVLQTGKELYTDGFATAAGFGTQAPPPFDALELWNGSLWGLVQRNGPELWFSWPQDANILHGQNPEWSLFNHIPLPPSIGQARALAGFDGQIVVFGSTADYQVAGSGPVRAVSYADDPSVYTLPTALLTPGGIVARNAVTKFPGGVIIQGAQGFTHLSRSLVYSFIGQAVAPLTDLYTYLPGALHAGLQALVFYAREQTGKHLAFYYNRNVWSQVEHPLAGGFVAAPVMNLVSVPGTRPTYLLTTSYANNFNVTSYSQYASWRSAWIEMTPYSNSLGSSQQMRSVAAYGTLREMQLIMDAYAPYSPGVTPTTITVKTEFDYENNPNQTPDVQVFTYSSGSLNPDTQLRWGVPVGGCRRVRFTVTVSQAASSDNNGAPLVLVSGIMLAFEVQDGLSRLGAGNSTNYP